MARLGEGFPARSGCGRPVGAYPRRQQWVGIAAVQIATAAGMQVIATAEAKRDGLQRTGRAMCSIITTLNI